MAYSSLPASITDIPSPNKAPSAITDIPSITDIPDKKSSGNNTHNVIGVGASVANVIAVNSVGNVIQVGV